MSLREDEETLIPMWELRELGCESRLVTPQRSSSRQSAPIADHGRVVRRIAVW